MRKRSNPGMTSVLRNAKWLHDAPVQAVFSAMRQDGHEARIVGGAVRNAILSAPIKDIDFATTAEPPVIELLASRAGLKTAPTGIGHGTVTVIAGGRTFEVTALRRDVETDGRRAVVAFTRDWAEDAMRRDFTMNALYANAEGALHDPLGGYADALAARVRFIGAADERIAEDYLRILRFFRFNAEYGAGDLDAEGLAACLRGRAGLATLSAERVRAEMLRILAAPGAGAAIGAMAAHGLLAQILGSPPRLETFERLVPIERAMKRAPDAILRLAALALGLDGEINVARRLKLSNAERARFEAGALSAPFSPAAGEEAAKAALYRMGETAFRDAALIAWARSGASPRSRAWRALTALPERWTPSEFPVGGDDLIARGAKPGPALGKTLARLEAAWIESGFTLSRDALLDMAVIG